MECGNGNVVNYFKKNKEDLNDEDIKQFIKVYKKYNRTIFFKTQKPWLVNCKFRISVNKC